MRGGEVLDQGAEFRTRLKRERFLQSVAIQWGAGMKQRVLRVSPPLHPFVSALLRPAQNQGWKISLEVLMQTKPLGFVQGDAVSCTEAFLPLTQPGTPLDLSTAEAQGLRSWIA